MFPTRKLGYAAGACALFASSLAPLVQAAAPAPQLLRPASSQALPKTAGNTPVLAPVVPQVHKTEKSDTGKPPRPGSGTSAPAGSSAKRSSATGPGTQTEDDAFVGVKGGRK